MVEQVFTYINDNCLMLLKYGVGGLVATFLIVWLGKGVNSRWRWSKEKKIQ